MENVVPMHGEHIVVHVHHDGLENYYVAIIGAILGASQLEIICHYSRSFVAYFCSVAEQYHLKAWRTLQVKLSYS